MKNSRVLLSTVAVLLSFSLQAEAKLYKWVDKDGVTHYGETIPPEYANSDTKTLEKGRLKDRKDGFDSSQSESGEAFEKTARETKRRDDALLSTYADEKEIDLARDRALLQVEARVNSYTTLLKTAQDTVNRLQQEKQTLTKQGRKIPASLEEDLQKSEALVERQKKALEDSREEMENVRARYEADRQRYRKLKGISDDATK